MTLSPNRFLAVIAACLVAAGWSYAGEPQVEHSSTDQSTRIDAHLEKKYTVTLDLEAPPTRRCQARVSIEYLQKNTDAAVNSTLENPDCEASSGSYTIAVRYKDESGEQHEAEFVENWERTDGKPIVAVQRYFVGENIDIIRVRTKRLQCLCAEVPDTSESH